MKIDIRKETRLETVSLNEVGAVLDYKLESTNSEGVADYIGLSIQNITDRLARIKEAEAQIKALKSELTEQIEIIKIGSAEWLKESGVEKLNGLYVSSVSISKAKPKEDLQVINEESLINQGYFKTVVDKTAAKQAILDGVEVDGAVIEVTHIEDKVRINMRKVSAT